MKHSDFKIGIEFLTATGRWRCTDVGARTNAAIRLDLDHDPAWYNGRAYAVVEQAFDEDAIEGCEPRPQERIFDDSGKACSVTIEPSPRRSPSRESPHPGPPRKRES